ncbi:hypothetical protein F5141DRAFT_1063906 [Pisolithus sp. B1]|nr:hypothetical protein F5141DRAFT_1063906 [Pisolithus sp. B1]
MHLPLRRAAVQYETSLGCRKGDDSRRRAQDENMYSKQSEKEKMETVHDIGPITCGSIAKNIRMVAIEPCLAAGLTTLHGVSLLTDETALKEAATYHPTENGVGGYCWKHAGNIYPFLDTYESAEQLAGKLAAGDVHLGKEVTVVVAHCFGEGISYPLLTALSCKEEDHADWQDLILKLVNMWYETDTHKKIGPLWSFATDSDATRRKAGHHVFMTTKLTTSSPLYCILSGLPGLNLYTGPHEMMMDFDYKHLFKLELIRTIIHLAKINPTKPPYTDHDGIPDVDTIIDFEAIKMLAQILHHLLEPFVNPTLSLSQQYRLNRAAFLPNQLYYDITTAMKNIIFCIAKQLWLNLSSKFSLLDVGTDQVEVLFALIWMCGGHNSTLNFTRSEHVDHINCGMWQGDTVVCNCNLQAAWSDGCAVVVSILSTSPLFPEEYDFDRIFSVEDVDLMCVFGGGKYPSINQEDEEDEEPLLSFEDQLENEMESGLIEGFMGLSSSTDSETNVAHHPSHPSPPSGKALVHSTSIHENGAARNDIHIKTLQANGSKIKISGNILTLIPSELTLNSGSPVSEFDLTWIWMGSYLKASTPVAGLAITTQKVIEISTTGSLIELVNPNVVIASAHLTTEKTKEINSQGLTWSLENEALNAAVDLIWKRMLELKIPVSSIALL